MVWKNRRKAQNPFDKQLLLNTSFILWCTFVYIVNSDGLPLSLETNLANRINFRASVQTMEEEEDPEPKPDICFKIKVADF